MSKKKIKIEKPIVNAKDMQGKKVRTPYGWIGIVNGYSVYTFENVIVDFGKGFFQDWPICRLTILD